MTTQFETTPFTPTQTLPVGPATWTFGDTFGVSTTTANDQWEPSVAVLEDGGFIVTWSSRHLGGANWEVMGQRYDAAGGAVGDEFTISGGSEGTEIYSAVTALSGGGFAVTWQTGQVDGNPGGIQARVYSDDGAGGEVIAVTSTGFGDQSEPTITQLADGGFVVSWQSYNQAGTNSYSDVYAQRFDASGQTVGDEVQVNQAIELSQGQVSLTGLSDGSYVAVYFSTLGDAQGGGVMARHFDASGNPGEPFPVNANTFNSQALPSVTNLADGGYVVTWSSNQQDGSSWGIYGQRFDAAGQPAGEEFQVNTTTESQQLYSSVDGLADGGFVVAFNSYGAGGWTTLGQRYDADGQAVDGEFTISQGPNNVPGFSGQHGGEAVAATADGGFVTAWTAWNVDGSRNGVFARVVEGDLSDLPVETPPTDVVGVFVDDDGNVFTEYADGSETAEFVDDSIFTQYADGSSQQTLADGTHYAWAIDGTETETFADGTVKISDPNGNVEASYSDGTTAHYGADGAGWERDPDGNVTSWSPDGSGSWEQSGGAFGAWSGNGAEVYVGSEGGGARMAADGEMSGFEAEILVGTDGADSFVFNATDEAMVIKNFNALEGDQVVIDGREISDLTGGDDGFGDWHVIDFTDGGFVALVGVTDGSDVALSWA
jgi:hypothetical protein